MPAGSAHQFLNGNSAVALRIRQDLLEFDHILVQFRVPAKPQLQGPFHGNKPLHRMDAIN